MNKEVKSCLHFVGFRDDRFWNATKVFGKPDFFHRVWDYRAKQEVQENDVVVFAKNDEHQEVVKYTFDDSAEF